MLNAYWEPLTFALPPVRPTAAAGGGASTRRWPLPDDIRPLEEAPIVAAGDIVAQPRSIVVLAQMVAAAGFRDARAGTAGR